MPARPIGYGQLVHRLIAGTPQQRAPVAGKAKPPIPNQIEEANRLRTRTGAGAEVAYTQRRGRGTAKRGRITVPARGTGRIFMFNPNDISDTKGTNWGSIDVPGASHPVYQFGSGGERLITFDLYIDGDRGRFGREQARDNGSLSITDELQWYRSLEYPTAYGGGFADVAPYVVLFTFGELYQNVPCIVKKADWKVNYWVPNPENGQPMPVRATIPMILAETPSRSQTANDVLNQAGLTAYEF